MIFETYRSADPRHIEAADLVRKWSVQAGASMLELTEARTDEFMLRVFAVRDGVVAGHAALRRGAAPSELQFVGHVVSPDLRRQGIGGALLRHLVAEVAMKTPNVSRFTAAVNKAGKSLHEGLGAVVIDRPGEVLTDCVYLSDLMPLIGRYNEQR